MKEQKTIDARAKRCMMFENTGIKDARVQAIVARGHEGAIKAILLTGRRP